MATSKNEKQGGVIETAAKSEKPGKLRTLTVRSGVTAGLLAKNHNETLVER